MTFTTGAVPPAATTGAATTISNSGATLNGTVNANNDTTTVTFEYGLDTTYGSSTAAVQSPVTGSGFTAVSVSLAGLIGDTTYHYRVVAQNSSGTTNGLDMAFVTGTSFPVVITNAPSSVGATGATLNGTVNASGNITTVTFEYGLDTSYGRTVTADQSPVVGTADTAVSATVSGLEPGATYHYRVVGENGVGTTFGEDVIIAAATLAAIPALSNVGLVVLIGLLMMIGVVMIGRVR